MANAKRQACYALYSLSFHRVGAGEGGETEAVLIAAAEDVSSFPYMGRSTAREALHFVSRVVSQRVKPHQKVALLDSSTDQDRKIFAQATGDGLVCVLAGHNEYPMRLAFSCIGRALRDFQAEFGVKWKQAAAGRKNAPALPWPGLAATLKDWQTPEKVDSMIKTQKEVEEVKDIMLDNIDKILARGEKLEDIVADAEELSGATKTFYRAAKKTNRRCACSVM